MLSILIPIYNRDVTKLVKALFQEIRTYELACEVLLLDDGSPSDSIKKVNKALTLELPVKYRELSENSGRSTARNTLRDLASGDFLLYLDADSEIIRSDFLRTYLDQCSPSEIIVGGRAYTKESPARIFHIHWKYGKTRESRPLSDRRRHPRRFFHSNNIVLPKSNLRFDPGFEGYGYEDIAFAFHATASGFAIKHIDNPVLHADLDQNQDFLHKHEEACTNLIRRIDTAELASVRLVSIYSTARRHALLRWFLAGSTFLRHPLRKLLGQGLYSGPVFDLFRLLTVAAADQVSKKV